jgi:hypothetical protein
MYKFLFIVLVITACSPKVRFTRLVTKHPELLTQDSVVLIDTFRVVVPEVKVDTVVKLNSLLDTVYLQQEQLKVKVWMKGDQVFIEGKCDTVYVDKIIERKVPVRYYEKTEKFIEKIKLAVMGTGITVFLLLIIYALYRILNRS